MTEELLIDRGGGTVTLTLNRPEKRNALSSTLLDTLADTFEELETDREARVIVIRGAGPAFCSGLDLKEMRSRQQGGGDPDTRVVEVFQRIERSRHPTIAAVHGDALAGGCELALHCDLRVAAENARFGMPLARLGLVVPFALGQKLVEIIGPAHTKHLLFTARPVSARRAYELGMVHELVSAAEHDEAVTNLAATVAANAPLSLAGMKLAVHRAIAAREGIAHDDIDALVNQARRSADASEGVQAMLEKRLPTFRGA